MSTQAKTKISPAAPATGIVVFVTELIVAHNAIRKGRGLKAITKDNMLQAACEAHCIEMAARGVMSHYGADGSNPFQRMTRAGYRFSWAGENVAFNYQSVAAVMDGWMRSPGHRANIIKRQYTNIGAACVYSAKGEPYWTVDFGAPLSGRRREAESAPALHTVTEQTMTVGTASSIQMEDNP